MKYQKIEIKYINARQQCININENSNVIEIYLEIFIKKNEECSKTIKFLLFS